MKELLSNQLAEVDDPRFVFNLRHPFIILVGTTLSSGPSQVLGESLIFSRPMWRV